MIGIRPALSAALAVAGVGAAFAPASPNPVDELGARRLVADRAAAAVRALDELDVALEPGVELARRGAARVVGGDEPPAGPLEEAAAAIAAAEDEEAAAARALDAAASAARARDPGADVAADLGRDEVTSIAAQLEATGTAAAAFAEMRWRAEGLVAILEASLAALADGDLEAAARLATAARTDHDAIATWEIELVTLPVWIATTDALIADVETIVDAARAGDDAAATAAAEAFAARAEAAAEADRALRIAMSEGGASVSAAPLSRLADLLATIDAERRRMEALGAAARP